MAPTISGITFISSYRGDHHYQVVFNDGTKHRLSVRFAPADFDAKLCPQDEADFNQTVNGQLGIIACGSPEVLTEQLVAHFNRREYQAYEAQLATMQASPKLYGDVKREPHPVFVAGRFDLATHTWVALQSFESARDLADIPADRCIDPRISPNSVLQ